MAGQGPLEFGTGNEGLCRKQPGLEIRVPRLACPTVPFPGNGGAGEPAKATNRGFLQSRNEPFLNCAMRYRLTGNSLGPLALSCPGDSAGEIPNFNRR